MIDKEKFEKIRNDIEKYDEFREEVIKSSRIVLKSAKLLIYSIHRKTDIETNLNDLKKYKIELDSIISKDPKLLSEGSYSEACQEYVEAMTYFNYFNNDSLVYPEDLGVSVEDYLMGICDLTGELARKAVMMAISCDIKELERIHSIVDEIFNEFLKFSFRNGHLRKKSDAIKWNLKKIEEVLYDYKIRKPTNVC